MVDVSIVIVSWNVRDMLRECLASIVASSADLHVETIVVDSASSDGSPNMVRAEFPEVTLIAQSENVGFTSGNNIGFEHATGRYLLLLNPDTVLLNDALAQMADYLDAHPEIGIVGPHTLNTDGSHQSTRRRFPTIALAFFESTWLQPYAPQKMLDRFYVRDLPDDETGAVDWVQGSALMARREIYEQIGGLDDGFVMFSEEVDWCKRARDAGWQAVYIGSAKIIHHGGKSTDQAGANKHIYFQQSKLRYIRKHHGAGIALVLRLFLLSNYAWQIALEGAKAMVGHKRDMRRQRIRAYWQVLRSGLKVSF